MSPIIPLRQRESSMLHHSLNILQLSPMFERGGDERHPHRVGR